jgi:hypothetical protein
MEIRLIKNEIANTWRHEFQFLSALSNTKFFRISGCCLQGIELIRVSNAVAKYRPHFSIYPLWKNNVKECFSEPIILHEFSNHKGLQYSIPYVPSDPLNIDAIGTVKSELKELFSDSTNKSLIEFTKGKLKDVLVTSSPIAQAKLLELVIFSALIQEDDSLLNIEFSRAKQATKYWKPELFNWKYGSKEKWISDIEYFILNRGTFKSAVESNINSKALKNLHS